MGDTQSGMNTCLRIPLMLMVLLLLPCTARANHGPATSAGGVSVESADTVPEGETSFVLRENYTSYEGLTRAEIESRAAAAGEFDYLDESFITSLGASYGVTEDFDLSASLGCTPVGVCRRGS